MTLLRNNNNKIFLGTQNLSGALKFLKVNSQYISIPHNTILDVGVTNNVSISAWFAITSVSDVANVYGIITKRMPATLYNGFSLAYKDDGASFSIIYQVIDNNANRGRIDATVMYSLLNKGINNVVLTRNGLNANNWNIYLNGSLLTKTVVDNALSSGSVVGTTAPAIINGFDNADYKADAFSSRVIVFNRLVTASEAYAMGTRSVISNKTGIIGDWEFNHKNGKTVTDYSTNANHGSLLNYTDAETASNGQPQSGNTAWVHPYNLTSPRT